MDFRDFELVLVDDGSTDDTPERLRAFRNAYPELAVTIVRNERNLGVAGARNIGVDASHGTYVAFTDSDCTVHPQWLGNLIRGFDSPEVMAVAGIVHNVSPQSLAERAYVGGTHIQRSPLQKRALVGGNMAFRREFIARYRFDEAVRYGCDEDDVAWRMRHDGHHIRFTSDAEVWHDHPMNLLDYMKLALRQGRGSAWLWYKHGVFVGRDLCCAVAAVLTLPLGFWDAQWLAVPAVFCLLQLCAIGYNQIVFKGNGFHEMIHVLPAEALYYLLKTFSFLATFAHILVGREPAIRQSRRQWFACRISRKARPRAKASYA